MNPWRGRLLKVGLVSGAGIVLPGANCVSARWGESKNLSRQRLGDRDYLLQLPNGIARIDKPLPVVLLFHGGGGRARAFARLLGDTHLTG